MPYERAKKFTRHNEKSISQFAQTHFLCKQRVMTVFLETTMSTPCDTRPRGSMIFFFLLRYHHFGHDFEHWPVANPYLVHAALQLKRLPTLH